MSSNSTKMSGVGNNGNNGKTKKVKKPSQAELFAAAKAKKNAEKATAKGPTKGRSANEAAAARAAHAEELAIAKNYRKRVERKLAKAKNTLIHRNRKND
jgi:molecular chaperone GrpE (heat shock protein)